MKYRYNQYCPCARCRCHGYKGPAILITIGVLFLFDQMGHAHWMGFHFTWPALLIVIGLISLLEHSASVNGHIPREYGANRPPNLGQPWAQPPAHPQYPGPGSVVTPPPVPPAGSITSGSSIVAPNDREVHNG
jgi:Domain of unknown function (DUF5668)